MFKSIVRHLQLCFCVKEKTVSENKSAVSNNFLCVFSHNTMTKILNAAAHGSYIPDAVVYLISHSISLIKLNLTFQLQLGR